MLFGGGRGFFCLDGVSVDKMEKIVWRQKLFMTELSSKIQQDK
jgi:hypothetical protein